MSQFPQYRPRHKRDSKHQFNSFASQCRTEINNGSGLLTQLNFFFCCFSGRCYCANHNVMSTLELLRTARLISRNQHCGWHHTYHTFGITQQNVNTFVEPQNEHDTQQNQLCITHTYRIEKKKTQHWLSQQEKKLGLVFAIFCQFQSHRPVQTASTTNLI